MGVLRTSLLLTSALLALAACQSDGQSSGDEPSSTEADGEVDGTLSGDPTAIRTFVEPAVEVADSADLADYVLPGLTGPGAECVEEGADVEVALGNDVEAGAASVSELVLSCVDQGEVGKIFAMYAVGFEADGPSRYVDLEECAAEGFADVSGAEAREALARVYGERLELTGPPTSRAVAAGEITRLTDCSPTSTPTADAASETPEPSATPEPSDEGPVESRVINWDRLQPGDCLTTLPLGRISKVTVVDCGTPHRVEVVGATFSAGADDATSQCANLYTAYTGESLDRSKYVLDQLEPEPGSLSQRLICLATPADGKATTGSLR